MSKTKIILLILIIITFTVFGFIIFTSKNPDEMCIQVIVEKENIFTGEVMTFPSPCEIPLFWQIFSRDVNSDL